MPRRPRVFVDGAAYHVYCRTGRSEPVFRQAAEVRDFLAIVQEVKREDGFAVLAWCVMPGHYHLVVRTGRIPLWRSMRLIQGRFAKSFNRRHEVLGPVWQGRYKAKLVLGELYLQQAIVYVHLNPTTAKLAPGPGAYRWSGQHEFEATTTPLLLDVDEMLLVFGGSGPGGRATYAQALAGAAAGPARPTELWNLPWWLDARPAGPTPPVARPRIDALGASTVERVPVPIGGFFAAAAAALGTTAEELRSGPRSRELTRLREAVTLVGVDRFNFAIKDLAAQFGRAPGVVSRWGVEGSRRQGSDAGLAASVQRLDAIVVVPDRESRVTNPVSSRPESANEELLGDNTAFVD